MSDVEQPQVRLEAALICDAVRTEDSGKHLMIGVYGGHILLPGTPASLGLSAYFMLAYQPTDGTPITFRVMHDGEIVQSMNGELRSDDPGTTPVVMNFGLKDVQKSGEISLEMQAQNGEWQVVCRRQLIVAEDTES